MADTDPTPQPPEVPEPPETRRWPIRPAEREQIVRDLVGAAQAADPRFKIKAADVLVRMESQNQSDEAERRKYERIDGGRATELVAIDPDARSAEADALEAELAALEPE